LRFLCFIGRRPGLARKGWGLQAANGGLAHAVGTGQIGLHSAFCESLDGRREQLTRPVLLAIGYHAVPLSQFDSGPLVAI